MLLEIKNYWRRYKKVFHHDKVIVVQAKKELYHERFIIAHELGHYYKICKAVNERYYKYNF